MLNLDNKSDNVMFPALSGARDCEACFDFVACWADETVSECHNNGFLTFRLWHSDESTVILLQRRSFRAYLSNSV